eukprot:CAMPEP_0197626578 /NCGR_PEP_ID=MMETSP1338-20131121/5480_1 /TAXON_ID=43686 ORGANISM="Pelagodinium beii, Strain RCC1491" /NCGR_SAMPLE_ID=MMETSP1338 /ASSEMBLY_ACC=CAM_ASM_000754 /LENGTH=395 /DNA_ID=CAMNT_0043197121 /DNA_START=24 /DNA_END=1211 /DNA_ORIENTATION=+
MSFARRKAGVLGLSGAGCWLLMETSSPSTFVATNHFRPLTPELTRASRRPTDALQKPMPRYSGVAAVAAAAALVPLSRRTLRRASAEPETVATEKPKENMEEEPEDEPFFEEVAGDDPMVLDLEERLRKMNGNPDLTLDMVLNPGTIVNAERDIILMRAELKATPEEEKELRKELEDKIEEKQMKVVSEMQNVMTDSLKLEFLIQAALGQIAFGFMVYGAWPWAPDLTWLNINKLGSELLIKLVGTWGTVILVVPALRARKPGGPYGMGYQEKRALDVSFLVLPFVNIIIPFFAQEPAITTYWLSTLGVLALYAWSFNTPVESDAKVKRRGAQDLNLPAPLMWAIQSLDYSTGSERGATGEDQSWQAQLRGYEEAAEKLEAERAAKAAKEKSKAA